MRNADEVIVVYQDADGNAVVSASMQAEQWRPFYDLVTSGGGRVIKTLSVGELVEKVVSKS